MTVLEYRIKKSRKYAKLTQPQLAELIGVSHRTLTSYEKDASKVTVRITQKIATECKINEIWLLTGHGEMIEDDKKSSSAKNLNVTTVVIEHQGLIKRFKNQERGLRWNERLVDIEDASEELCDKVDDYLQGIHDAAQVIKASKKTANEDKDDLQDKKSS